MAERVKVRRCPRCGRDAALKIVYHVRLNMHDERDLLGVDAQCSACGFSRHLDGYATARPAS